MKCRFRILQGVCEYPVSVQVKLFAAPCALHNFILANDDTDVGYWFDGQAEDIGEPPLTGYSREYGDCDEVPDLHGAISARESDQADRRQDEIAHAMWASYQEELGRRQSQ